MSDQNLQKTRFHKIHGTESILIAEAEFPPGVVMHTGIRDTTEIDAEINEICLVEGDRLFMGEIGNPLHTQPRPIFWVEDKDGNIASFKRLHHLQVYQAERAYPTPEAG